MREDLTGRIESEGWPVIFVQADIPGQPWWCQAPVAKVDGGRFSTKVVFGDEFTPQWHEIPNRRHRHPHPRGGTQVRHRFQATGPARRLSAIGRGRRHASVNHRPDAPACFATGVGGFPRPRRMSPHRSTGVLILPRRTVAHAVILAFLSGLCPVAAQAGGGMPTVVKVQRDETGYHLLRDGRPYMIKGGGGRVYLEALKEAGGNSLRTWGEDDLEPLLDRAHELGLTVTVGIWLGQERQGFNYADAGSVRREVEKARAFSAAIAATPPS